MFRVGTVFVIYLLCYLNFPWYMVRWIETRIFLSMFGCCSTVNIHPHDLSSCSTCWLISWWSHCFSLLSNHQVRVSAALETGDLVLRLMWSVVMILVLSMLREEVICLVLACASLTPGMIETRKYQRKWIIKIAINSNTTLRCIDWDNNNGEHIRPTHSCYLLQYMMTSSGLLEGDHVA